MTGTTRGGIEREASGPKPGRWIGKPRKARWVVPLTSIAVVAQIPSWTHAFIHGKGSESLVLLFLAVELVALLSCLVVGLLAMRRNRRDLAETEAMLDGGFGDQFAANVAVVAAGRNLGSDQGVVWFAEGLMGFSGQASSFVLAPEDVRPHAAYSGSGRRPKALPANAIVLRDAPREAYVVVTPLGRGAKSYRERLSAFLPGKRGTEDERLARYVMGENPGSRERQWPPLVPYETQVKLPTEGRA